MAKTLSCPCLCTCVVWLHQAVARAARDYLRMHATGGDLGELNIRADARRLVRGFLSLSRDDAPECQPLSAAEPTPQALPLVSQSHRVGPSC